jgi:tetratricopeptide (TPR) repeat protein
MKVMRLSLLALLLCAYGVLCWNTYAVPSTNKNSSAEHSLTSPNPEGEIEDVWFFTRRGGVRFREGKFAEAIADYTRVIALSPTNAYAYCNRGACLSEMGDFDRAVSDLNVAIALDPNLTASYFNRATVRRRQGDLDAALADFTKVIELDPKKLKVYESRWFVFYKLGRPD